MVEEDGLDGDGETAGGGIVTENPDVPEEEVEIAASSTVCLSCGAPVVGVFCNQCGQKQDDLRRSLLLLGRDFIEDTFAFDSRMWRTLGLLAISPGVVPTMFSHGQRSQFTPPIRLFLVVSFLFFLTVGLTNTLFVAMDVEFREQAPSESSADADAPSDTSTDVQVIVGDEGDNKISCSFEGNLKFFIKERDLTTDKERLDFCLSDTRDQIKNEVLTSDDVSVQIGKDEGDVAEREQASQIVERVFEGVGWAVANPREFNAAINNWLPRVMFLMTPILALILSLYLRRDLFLFDHMVLSLYIHAVNFVIVGFSLILTQIGVPFAGYAAALLIAVYYVIAIKRAYNRGWAKTLWTAWSSSTVYIMVFSIVLITIVSNVVWRAVA